MEHQSETVGNPVIDTLLIIGTGAAAGVISKISENPLYMQCLHVILFAGLSWLTKISLDHAAKKIKERREK